MTTTAILTDVIEHLSEEIIFDDNHDDRLEKWQTLQVRKLTMNAVMIVAAHNGMTLTLHSSFF
jgi:hypothetical protein